MSIDGIDGRLVLASQLRTYIATIAEEGEPEVCAVEEIIEGILMLAEKRAEQAIERALARHVSENPHLYPGGSS